MRKRHIPEILHRKGKRKSAGAAVAALVVCFLLLLLLGPLSGEVFGRYQRQFRSDVPVRAQEFYFTSNFLDGKTHTLAPGSTEVKFTLGNHADELRFSEVDIEYEVTVTPKGGGTATVKVGDASGTLKANERSDADVVISDLQAGTYTVTAVGTGGYSKTLTATIVVPERKAQLYQHQETVPGEYILLTVWNEGDEDGTVTIAYTGIPDNTNPDMQTWETGVGSENNQEVSIAAHASKVFRFFGETVTVTAKGPDGKDLIDKEPR